MSVIKVKAWGKDQGDHVLINESDFDPKLHKLFDEQPKASKGLNVDQIKVALTEKGIEFSESANKPELAKLLDDAE
ncbi:conserved protein of unknown function [Pseudomonas marincola]|uniref:HeH/LEM domain-containing protein n=1 Tax=Pseudomonas marincola TaxID=437900 RepID=A0A653E887_9PSED|nr:hypothetical protein [Pseudomonas marincola]CAE6906736.1 conserved protein of unknown function [Pseudomonas marincola]